MISSTVLVLVTVLLLTVLLVQSNVIPTPTVFGCMLMTVRSSSMEPVLREGDIIVTERLSAQERSALAVGDIISYYVDLNGDGVQEINTHTIVDIVTDADGQCRYITRGENNPTNDRDPVSPEQILGRYVGRRLGGVGYAVTFLHSPTGLFLCVLLPLIAFFLYALVRFVMAVCEFRAGQRSADEIEQIKRRAVEEYLREQTERDKERTP